MGRVLTAAEIEQLRERHYWEYWNWAGPAYQGEVIHDQVFGPVLASTDPEGRAWFIIGANSSLVANVQKPEYFEDPQYAEAIQAAFRWELEQAKAIAQGATQTAVDVLKPIAQGAAEIAKPIFDLTTPLLLAAAVVGGLYLLSNLKAGAR